jgi:putative FmdB family regulatory protein
VPIYTYELEEGESPCGLCGGAFELRRPADREPLTHCPLCKKKVRKVIGTFHTPKVLRKVGTAEARNAGFKVYKKTSGGEYERQ